MHGRLTFGEIDTVTCDGLEALDRPDLAPGDLRPCAFVEMTEKMVLILSGSIVFAVGSMLRRR